MLNKKRNIQAILEKSQLQQVLFVTFLINFAAKKHETQEFTLNYLFSGMPVCHRTESSVAL